MIKTSDNFNLTEVIYLQNKKRKLFRKWERLIAVFLRAADALNNYPPIVKASVSTVLIGPVIMFEYLHSDFYKLISSGASDIV